MRNAITPIISIVAPQVAGIVTGSFVIERIFSVPGLGRYYVDSVNGRDYPMILATTFIFLHDFYRLHGRYGYSLCDCGSACP